jgi:pSer/pThr/pTyr-binding forkhead associated (FHA) protein
MTKEAVALQAQLLGNGGVVIDLQGEMTVGRTEQSEITIADPRISRAHARLSVRADGVTVEDLGSANGTTVNGIPVSGVMRLANGDKLAFEKHEFTVQLIGGADSDATMLMDMGDATVLTDATMLAAPEPPQTPPAAPVAPPAPAPAAPRDLPGSWTDSGVGEQTRILSMEDLGSAAGAAGAAERVMDSAHLMYLENGRVIEVYELELTLGNDPDVWEIGRETGCQIVVPDASVSARHAQLIHDGGRWRVVNLVSANGIFINGEKRLTAYLSSGDALRLGSASLVFHGARNAAAAAGKSPASAAKNPRGGGNRFPLVPVAVGALIALTGLAAWWFLLG